MSIAMPCELYKIRGKGPKEPGGRGTIRVDVSKLKWREVGGARNSIQ